ncbi:hypothetical protein PM3016_6822 [Paenibacillus mucilaginosus 3016]|uniref:Uncharacterized protein n=1 Tax=Paenibacillus mucilaginosus 3016 TaxID=1116391 RepID=H6NPS0_9BACL|nr:hypothetical protein PM3016_6822 [Paenibacillus mucilaginosus 3016]
MQHDQAHPVQDAVLDALHDFVAHFVVRDMAPPEEDVGVVEHFLGQAVFRLIEGGIRNFHLVAQPFADRGMNAVRVDGADFLIFLLMTEFVPDRHTQFGLCHVGSLQGLVVVVRIVLAVIRYL